MILTLNNKTCTCENQEMPHAFYFKGGKLLCVNCDAEMPVQLGGDTCEICHGTGKTIGKLYFSEDADPVHMEVVCACRTR